MSSPLGGWINSSRFEDRPAVLPFITLCQAIQTFIENHLSRIRCWSCGVMVGSSVVLPSLYPAALDLRGLYRLAFGISVCSGTLFTILNGAEIALNGKFTLAGVVVLITLVLLSQRTSPEAFIPYIPISVALGLLVTIYVVPWIRAYLQQRNRIILSDYVMATRGDTSPGSYRAAVDPFSVRSARASHGDLNSDLELGPLPLEFDHMGHLGGQYQRPYPSAENASSVELDSGLHQEAETSTASADSRDPCL
jgi:hypothetical protein